MTLYSREWTLNTIPNKKPGDIELTSRGLICAVTGNPVRIENGKAVVVQRGKRGIERIAA